MYHESCHEAKFSQAQFCIYLSGGFGSQFFQTPISRTTQIKRKPTKNSVNHSCHCQKRICIFFVEDHSLMLPILAFFAFCLVACLFFCIVLFVYLFVFLFCFVFVICLFCFFVCFFALFVCLFLFVLFCFFVCFYLFCLFVSLFCLSCLFVLFYLFFCLFCFVCLFCICICLSMLSFIVCLHETQNQFNKYLRVLVQHNLRSCCITTECV